MRLLLLSFIVCCLSEYAFSRPWCRGGRYDPVTKKCVYPNTPRPAPVCPNGYRWNETQNRCVRTDSPAPVCPNGYRWNEAQNKCVLKKRCRPGNRWNEELGRCVRSQHNRCRRGYHWDRGERRCVRSQHNRCRRGYHWDRGERRCVRTNRPAPRPNPERRGDARIFETTYYMSEPASVTVTSVHNDVDYQKTVKGTAYALVKHRVGEFHDKIFDNVAKMKSYLLEHACQVDSTEGALAFKSAEDAKGASMEVLLAENGSLSSEAKVHIEVRYLHGPPSGRGQAHFRNIKIDCP